MKKTRMVKIAWGALKNRKLRAVLTILGITIGPAVIVALVGATSGFSISVVRRFNNLGITTLFVQSGGFRSSVNIDDRVVASIASIEGVKDVAPYYRITGTTSTGGQTVNVVIIALDVSKLQSLFPGITLAEGDFPASISQSVIGSNIANPQGGTPVRINGAISASINTRIGDRIVRANRAFLAAGILQPFGQIFFLNPDDTVFVPKSMGRSITGTPHYSGLFVQVRTPEDVSSIQNTITDLYGTSLRIVAISAFVSNIQSVIGGISTILVSVAFMSMIVAFIGIMTTMFTSVAERTKEIGILKSLGYSPRDIMGIFLSEATLTGTLGGLAGIALGSVLSFAVMGLFGGGFGFRGPPGFSGGTPLQITPVITLELLAGTFLMATGIGALAGLLPSYRASKLIPVVALRHK